VNKYNIFADSLYFEIKIRRQGPKTAGYRRKPAAISNPVHVMQIQKYCIFSNSAIFIYIRTQAFADDEILTSVIFTNNKRVGSSKYLIVRSARKLCFHIWHKRVPNFLIWHKRVPKIFYRSCYDVIRFLPLGTI
jgi:hypothetical protein